MIIIIDEANPDLETIVIDTDAEGELGHVYCEICHPDGDMALCGTDVSDYEITDEGYEEAECIVCREVDDIHYHEERDGCRSS